MKADRQQQARKVPFPLHIGLITVYTRSFQVPREGKGHKLIGRKSERPTKRSLLLDQSFLIAKVIAKD